MPDSATLNVGRSSRWQPTKQGRTTYGSLRTTYGPRARSVGPDPSVATAVADPIHPQGTLRQDRRVPCVRGRVDHVRPPGAILGPAWAWSGPAKRAQARQRHPPPLCPNWPNSPIRPIRLNPQPYSPAYSPKSANRTQPTKAQARGKPNQSDNRGLDSPLSQAPYSLSHDSCSMYRGRGLGGMLLI